MTSAVCELEVVVRIGLAQHDTVKTFVVLEAANDPKPEATAIHGLRFRKIADRASNSKVMWHSCLSDVEAA